MVSSSEKAKERNERILLSLKSMDYLNTNQICQLFGLKKDNAYRILRQLKPYLGVFKDDGTNIYYLNKAGREIVHCEKVRKKLTTAQHYIMRNDLYILLGKPTSWRNEILIRYVYEKNNPKSRHITVVADAHFVRDNKHHVIEIDNEQRMYKNKLKIERYRRLIEKNVFGGIPKLIWVTTTSYRKQTLEEYCDGMDITIYLRSDLI